jgi:hypothetical protein
VDETIAAAYGLPGRSPNRDRFDVLLNSVEVEMFTPYWDDVLSYELPEVGQTRNPVEYLTSLQPWADCALMLVSDSALDSSKLEPMLLELKVLIDGYVSKLTANHLLLDAIVSPLTKFNSSRVRFWRLAAQIADASIYDGEPLSMAAQRLDTLVTLIEEDEATRPKVLSTTHKYLSIEDFRGLIAELELKALLVE